MQFQESRLSSLFPHQSGDMACIPRSGNDWTTKELAAFNIRVADATVPAFFESSELPRTPVSTTILDNLNIPSGPLWKDDRLFFQYLMLEEQATSEEYAVDDFTGFLLRMLDYDRIDGVYGLVQISPSWRGRTLALTRRPTCAL